MKNHFPWFRIPDFDGPADLVAVKINKFWQFSAEREETGPSAGSER
jgi:hypothetical protein